MQRVSRPAGMHKMSSLLALSACLFLMIETAEAAQAQSAVKVQTLTSDGASCSVAVPTNFTLTEKQTAAGKMFIFADATKDKLNAASFSVSIVPFEGNPSLNELLDGVLDPYKEGLKNYKVEKKPVASISGNAFENRSFSGNFPKGTPIAGFVYGAAKKNVEFILVGQANGAQGAQSVEQLAKIVKSFK